MAAVENRNASALQIGIPQQRIAVIFDYGNETEVIFVEIDGCNQLIGNYRGVKYYHGTRSNQDNFLS
jgi:hypothetical protein